MAKHLDHDWFPEPLPDNVVLGERTWLYSSFAFRHYNSQRPVGVRVGSDTGLYNGTFFDLGPAGEVEIGNYCALVGAIISTNGRVAIADYALIAHEVVFADASTAVPFRHHAAVLDRRAVESKQGPSTSIVIEEKVWIAARAVLLGGAHIGEASIVGAAAVVDFRVPPYSLVAGNPARVIRRFEPPL